MVAGSNRNLTLSFTNTGSITWQSGGSAAAVKLTYRWRNSTCASVVLESGTLWWLAANVPAGGSVTNYPMSVTSPATAGTYCLEFDLTQNGTTFSSMGRPTLRVNVTVGTQSAYNVSWGSHTVPSTMPTSATTGLRLTFTNNGTTTWQSGGSATAVKLTYRWRNSTCASVVQESGTLWWLAANVPPGGSVNNYPMSVLSPATAGTYCLEFDLTQNGTTFSSMGRPTLRVNVTVGTQSPYNVSWGSHSVPSSLTAGVPSNLVLSFTNTGSATWQSGGAATAVKLTYRWRNDTCASVVQESGTLWWLAANVPPGGSVNNYPMSVVAPNPGTYCLEFDLTQNGTTFSSLGRPTLRVVVVVGGASNDPG
jgi:peptidoglycan hydrolase-like amidase